MDTEKYYLLKQLLVKRMTGQTLAIDSGFMAEEALRQVDLRAEDLEREEPIHVDLRVSAQPLLNEEGDVYWQFTIVGPE